MIYQDNIKMHEYHGPMKWKIDQLFQKDKESCGENFQEWFKKAWCFINHDQQENG